ncbi:hypothetical protein [Methylobacterium sp. NEAU K]|uniref:hypothetical protein n=1 Tax=Methylobacterium sp. NEAU K TaxID=3064946 RepID=UPI002732D3CA|nr:hypothetical protein [Methylobacterium sp. NEAU K]MDP4005982.1 hypothetical protein [Methylobacterium sp. NEAU K]
MGSNDPELRARQLAALRAVYESCPGRTDDRTASGITRHTKALLGRILIVLGGLQEGTGTRR